MGEVINWLTRNPDSYAIFGASVYDDNFETWVHGINSPTELATYNFNSVTVMQEFLDVVAESWDIHFEKDNMPRNGGHFVYFYPEGNREAGWFAKEWEGKDSEEFLSELVKMIGKHWHMDWVCGYGHLTSEAFYEINWRRYNV